MPGNDGNPIVAKNFIGRHTAAELASLPVEKNRQGNWCWHIDMGAPYIYNGVAWVPFGGGGPAGGGGFYQSGIDVYVAPTHPDAVDDADLTTPFITIQGALNAIGVPASLAEQRTRYAIYVEAGEYDEDLSIPEARILNLIAMGPVVLGDGAGDFYQSSTTPRNITYNVNQANEFPNGPRPYLGIGTTQVQGSGRGVHNAYGSGWIISGTIIGNLSGGPADVSTHEIQLQQCFVQQGMDWSPNPGSGCNSYFDHCAIGPTDEDAPAIVGTAGGASFRIVWANETIFGSPYGGGPADVVITFWNRFTHCNFTQDLVCTVGYVADPELAPGGMFGCEIAGNYNSPGAFFIDAATYHNFRANGGVLLGGATLDVIDGTQGIAFDGNAADFATIMEFLSGAGITLSAPGPGQLQIDAIGAVPTIGGGDQEKPWDYHDITEITRGSFGASYKGNNGYPNQRCMTLLQDGRLLILWHDGSTVLPGAGNLFLTVVHQEDYSRKYHEYTYSLNIQTYNEQPLQPNTGDMCIVAEQGEEDGEMIHIVFTAEDPTAIGVDSVYDAYFPTTSLPYAQPVVIGTLSLSAERINNTVGPAPCMHPSVAAAPGLTKGPGVVVVYTHDQTGGGITQIISDFYDPTQLAGQRYFNLLTGYSECIVSDLATIGADWATVETDPANANYHCCYTAADGIGGTHLYYSNTSAGGPPAIQLQWDNVLLMTQPVDGLGTHPFGTLLERAPSMVIIQGDSLDPPQPVIIVGIEDFLTQTEIMCYTFTEDIATLYPLPSFMTEDICDILDPTKASNGPTLGGNYQIGISNLAVSENPIIYVYKEALANDDYAPNSTDFFLMYKDFSQLRNVVPGPAPPLTDPFNNVPLEMNVSLMDLHLGPEFGLYNYTPKVHFNAIYIQGPLMNPDTRPSYFPINSFKRVASVGVWDGDAAYDMRPTTVMTLKDIPLYIIGGELP